MLRIGVFGGTFNPVHIGHLILAQEVLDKFKLDRIIFIPSKNPPHKTNKNEISSPMDRYNMVKKAIESNHNFFISDIEIKRDGLTYSYDTLLELKEIYDENTKIYFILGYDAFKWIDSWKNVKEVFELTSFIVVNREIECDEMNNEIRDKVEKYGGEVYSAIIPNIEVSSTEIRRRIKEGETIKYLVPSQVEEYIRINNLYIGDLNDEV